MEEKEKYYPFRYTDGYNFVANYYTYDVEIYDRALKLRKWDTFSDFLNVSCVLLILVAIVFAVLGNILFTCGFIGLFVINLIIVCIVDAIIGNWWYDLYTKFENNKEVQEQFNAEQELLEKEELEKITTIAKNVVEIYNIVDNKKLKKSTKIQKVSKYIKEIKENK